MADIVGTLPDDIEPHRAAIVGALIDHVVCAADSAGVSYGEWGWRAVIRDVWPDTPSGHRKFWADVDAAIEDVVD